MNEEITATMPFDAPTMLAGYKWHSRRSTVFGWPLWVAVALVVISTIPSIISQGKIQMFPQYWFLVGAALLLALAYWMGPRIYLRALKTSPSFGTTVSYQFNDQGLLVRMPLGEGKFDWDYFIESISTPDGAMIYSHKKAFNWLPKTAFSSESDYDRFLQLISTKTKHSKIG
ncbi:YcxB family protein [Prosthecobacter fusiformis]|nr:YcxB family protein [Prosthecobacter fusiformis]